MSSEYDSRCWKCKEKPGTYLHMWWHCPLVQKFWLLVYKELRSILNCTFAFSARIMLLCDFGGILLEKYTEVAAHLLAAVTQLIAQIWKKGKPSLFMEWVAKAWHVFLMSKVTAVVRFYAGDIEAMNQWLIYINFVGNQKKAVNIRSQILELF